MRCIHKFSQTKRKKKKWSDIIHIEIEMHVPQCDEYFP